MNSRLLNKEKDCRISKNEAYEFKSCILYLEHFTFFLVSNKAFATSYIHVFHLYVRMFMHIYAQKEVVVPKPNCVHLWRVLVL